jgi:hypothetical protein
MASNMIWRVCDKVIGGAIVGWDGLLGVAGRGAVEVQVFERREAEVATGIVA